MIKLRVNAFGLSRLATARVEQAKIVDQGVAEPGVKICINGQFGTFEGMMSREMAAQLAVDLMAAVVDAKG